MVLAKSLGGFVGSSPDRLSADMYQMAESRTILSKKGLRRDNSTTLTWSCVFNQNSHYLDTANYEQGAFMRHGVLQREVVSESMLTILAGSDTTATAIRTTMLYIMATARVYSRLKNEIREAVVSGSVSSPITVEQAKQLPYLQVG